MNEEDNKKICAALTECLSKIVGKEIKTFKVSYSNSDYDRFYVHFHVLYEETSGSGGITSLVIDRTLLGMEIPAKKE